MASGGNGRQSRAAAPDWHVRLARIQELETRLGIAELECDPFATNDEQLILIHRLEAQIQALSADGEERLKVIQALTAQIADLRTARDALIHTLTDQIGDLRVTRDELERMIARHQERARRLEHELLQARAAGRDLEGRCAAQAAQLAAQAAQLVSQASQRPEVQRQQAGITVALATSVRALVRRCVRRFDGAWRRVTVRGATLRGVASSASGRPTRGAP